MHKLLTNPFIVAPMAGITDMPFRRLMRKLGAGGVISEFVSSHLVTQKDNPRRRRYLAYHEDEMPLGIQLFGGDEKILIDAAKRVEETGVNYVDLNLGCPVNKVVKKGGGSAWLCHPVELGKMLEDLVKAIEIPLTIKIRLGWDSNSINAKEIAKIAYESGVEWVAVHGRTRKQGYSGLADWEQIAELASESKIPIIGNGDVISGPLAAARLLDSGVLGVMIGRAALKNPWIFQEALESYESLMALDETKRQAFVKELIAIHKAPEGNTGRRYQPRPIEGLEKWMTIRADRDAEELVDMHLTLLLDAYPEERAYLAFRKFLAWYSAGYPGSSQFRKEIFTTKDYKSVVKRALEFFEEVKSYADSRDDAPVLMSGHG